jgi:hypothetical protein
MSPPLGDGKPASPASRLPNSFAMTAGCREAVTLEEPIGFSAVGSGYYRSLGKKGDARLAPSQVGVFRRECVHASRQSSASRRARFGATVQDLQDKIDSIMVPGQAIVLDLAQLTFLDTSAIHCCIRAEAESGHPVVLMNASRAVRRILNLARLDSYPWVFDGHGPAPASV